MPDPCELITHRHHLRFLDYLRCCINLFHGLILLLTLGLDLLIFSVCLLISRELGHLLNWVFDFPLKLDSLYSFVARVDFPFYRGRVHIELQMRRENWMQMRWYRAESFQFLDLLRDLKGAVGLGQSLTRGWREYLLDCIIFGWDFGIKGGFIFWDKSSWLRGQC